MIDNPKLRTLKEQLEAEIAKAERSAVADPQRFIGFDWWQMTPEEQSVFGIDPKRLPRMGVTWFCYEAVKLIADADTWDADLIRDARQEHPYWCDEAPSQLEFADFAKEYAGLTFRESDAFYNKNKCWRVRMGITRFRDEPQQQDNEPETHRAPEPRGDPDAHRP